MFLFVCVYCFLHTIHLRMGVYALSLTLLYKKNVSEAADTSSLTVIGVGVERVGDCAGRKGCSDIQPACVGAQLCVCVFAHACE